MFPILAGSNPSGYNLTRSLRVRSSATANLTRTFSSAGNRRTWTWSGWVKLGLISSSRSLFSANAAASAIGFDTNSGTYEIFVDGTYTSTRTFRYTAALYRDPAAWYHIVVALDTTQATDTNRIKLYVNGAQVSLTNVAVGSWPAQNSEGSINNNIQHCIGQRIFTTDYNFDGYLTEVNFIDGQALTPSSFGSTNALTGVWQPAAYTGTYGTNGFELQFTDNSAATAAAIGKDSSGNGNNWTPNNISITAGVTYDSMTDVPTLTSATAANFAVLNPLDVSATQLTLSDGNLTATQPSTGTSRAASSTFRVSTGKWYFEGTTTVTSGTSGSIGIADNANAVATYGGYRRSGGTFGLTGSPTFSTYTNGDVIGVAFDADAKTVSFYKNGTLQGTGGYTYTGSDPVGSRATVDSGDSTGAWQLNFGQRPFAYTPPTGFVALNTYNLPTSTIVKGNTVMDATIYTGTGVATNIVNAAGFKPDFVWDKSRSNAYSNKLYDSVRGAGVILSSNSTSAESTDLNTLSSFNSNGFGVGTDAGINGSGSTFVAWQWQAGQGSSSSNTNGTITSTVSVNASAGFSVVTFAASVALSPQTVGHGLGVAPSLIIVKPRSSAGGGWYTYHSAIGATQLLQLNLTSAQQTTSGPWNNTAPTSSVFTLGGSYFPDAGATTYVAYCWTPIAGFSAFGSYTGNGSTDGPFVYTGFRPKFVLIKRTDTTSDWRIWDTARTPYNAMSSILYPNGSDAEFTASSQDFDALSNGFKIRNSSAAINASGGTYIYAAFAENPFKNALAR